MQSFLQFLKEESEEGDGKLKHITHIEDHILHDGAAGFNHATGALDQVVKHIKSGKKDASLTMKHDGSPAIVYGHHPETGKFFVASKSAFNKNPKINYTNDDIQKNHGHAPGLVEKLKHALHHLPKVVPHTGVYQGDVMFSHGDKTHHEGKVHFKPNTIMYSAPENSTDGKKIKRAKFGLYTHTQYHGNDIESMKADFNPDMSGFKDHPDVYHRLPGHDTSKVTMTPEDEKQYKHHLDTAKELHDEHGKSMYKATEPHRSSGGHIETYINSTVRNNEKPTVSGLKKHMEDKYRKELSKLKTPAGQSRKETEMNNNLNHVENNREHYKNLLQTHDHLQKAKDVLVHVLARHTGGLDHSVGDSSVKPEGFVVNHKGSVSKLNDRKEFNRLNFLTRSK